MKEKIEKLQQFIDESKHIVFFGGAGVSTESGVPDFRSKDGLYNQHDVQFERFDPEYLLSHSCLVDHPKVFYEYYRQKMDARHVEPNITHKVLARMEEEGKLLAVVTQNIDGSIKKQAVKKSTNFMALHSATTVLGARKDIHLTTCLNPAKPYQNVPVADKSVQMSPYMKRHYRTKP